MIAINQLFKEILAKGRELEKAQNAREVKIIDHHGYAYQVLPGGQLAPVIGPGFPTVTVHTLVGLAKYVQADVDNTSHAIQTKAEAEAGAAPDIVPTVLVEDHETVRLFAKPDIRRHDQRNTFCLAKALVPKQFAFGTFMDADDFIIELLSKFTDTADRGRALKLVGSMTTGAVRESSDDGVTQTVNVKAGVALKGLGEVTNPFYLCPYRTFHDVSQPVSPFVLRVRQVGSGEGARPQVALFEADGGQWKVDALKSIVSYLTSILPASTVILH